MYKTKVITKTIIKALLFLAVVFTGIIALRMVSLAGVVEKGPRCELRSDERFKALKTSLRNGDIYESIRLDWLPRIRNLAAGKIPGDEFEWDFDNSPLYVDQMDSTGIRLEFIYCMEQSIADPGRVAKLSGESPTGLFDLGKLDYEMETRKIKDNDGREFYRCALTRITVKWWNSPYGRCSREEAISYYNKCQKKIGAVVKMVMKARRKGKPLSKVNKLKYIHDWLIYSVEYDYKDLAALEEESTAGASNKYRYMYNEYGAIVEGQAICQGYAYAFKAIVDELNRQTNSGIKCEIAYASDHAWNRVKLNGKWYHIDVTWDDSGKKDFFTKRSNTRYFLFSDSRRGWNYWTSSMSSEPANDKRYEGKKWPKYQKNLKECTVSLKHPNKVYVYRGKQIIPEVVVKYGRNVIPKAAYRVVRMDKKKTGTATIKIVPSKKCTSLCGKVKGLRFKIKKRRF